MAQPGVSAASRLGRLVSRRLLPLCQAGFHE